MRYHRKPTPAGHKNVAILETIFRPACRRCRRRFFSKRSAKVIAVFHFAFDSCALGLFLRSLSATDDHPQKRR